MAIKVIGIEITADTSKAAPKLEKLNLILDKQSKELLQASSNQQILANIEKTRQGLLDAQQKAYEKLLTVQDKLNSSSRSAKSTYGALSAALVGYQNSIRKTTEELSKLQDKENQIHQQQAARNTGSIYGTAGTRPVGSNVNTAGFNYGGGKTISSPTPSIFGVTAAAGAYSASRAYTGVADARAKADAEAARQVATAEAQANKQRAEALRLNRQHLPLIKDIAKEHTNLLTHISEIYLGYRLVDSAINNIIQALKNIPAAGIGMQANQAPIFAMFGSREGVNNLKELNVLADEAGQNIKVLETTYARYATSATLAGASQAEVNKSFKDFTEVGTVLHLTQDRMDNLFLALDQMFAKGVVQSEEIKKQLGNVLPGAVEVGAKAMGKSPAAFMEAMKKNEVIAKEFVPKFAALYRQILGGSNDEVFKTVQDRLFANLIRIQNQYELFNRNVFTALQEKMNSTAKTVVSALRFINDNVGGILQIIGASLALITVRIGYLATASLAGAVANHIYAGSFIEVAFAQDKVIKGALRLPAVTAAFEGLKAALSSPVAIIAGSVTAVTSLALAWEGATIKYDKYVGRSKEGIAELMQVYASQKEGAQQAGEELERLAKIQETSNSAFITLGTTQIELSTIFSTAWENIKTSVSTVWESITNIITKGFELLSNIFTAIINDIKAEFNEFTSFIRRILEGIFDFFNAIISRIEGVGGAISAAISSIENRDYSNLGANIASAYTRNTEKALKENKDSFIGIGNSIGEFISTGLSSLNKEVSPYTKLISDIPKSFAEQLKVMQDIKNKEKAKLSPTIAAPELPPILDDIIGGKKGKTGSNKAITDAYRLLNQEASAYTKNISRQTAELDRLYKYQAISIQEYFDRKEELQKKDLTKQLELAEKAREIAFKASDTSKIDEYTIKIEDLTDKMLASQRELADARVNELYKFNDVLRNIEADYNKLTGNFALISKGNESDITAKYAKQKAIIEEEIAAGNTRYQKDLQMLGVLKQHEIVMKNISDIEATQAKYKESLRLEEERINVARNSGLVNDIQATNELVKAREYYGNLLEEGVTYIERQAALNEQDAEAVQKAIAARRELNALKNPLGGYTNNYLKSGGGQFDFINEALTRQNNFAKENAYEQSKTAIPYQDASGTYLEVLEQKKQADDKYTKATLVNYSDMFSGIAEIGANTFLGLTQQMQQMYGANSKEARRAFAMYKAMAISQAIISTAAGAMKAYEQTGIYGAIGAALVIAQGAVQVAQIAAQPMPAAHGGLDYVPKEQTYLLDKGERVLSPKQNKDLTSYINQRNINQNTPVENKVRIINTIDPNVFGEYLSTSEGEKVIMNVVRRNREEV